MFFVWWISTILQIEKGPSTSTKDFFYRNIYFLINFFSNYIILQWVLGLVTKMYKYFNKFILPYMVYSQNMVKLSCGWYWRRLKNWKN
jgi:heme/copper-type cytochrome/quinol oxidase subunit 1